MEPLVGLQLVNPPPGHGRREPSRRFPNYSYDEQERPVRRRRRTGTKRNGTTTQEDYSMVKRKPRRKTTRKKTVRKNPKRVAAAKKAWRSRKRKATRPKRKVKRNPTPRKVRSGGSQPTAAAVKKRQDELKRKRAARKAAATRKKNAAAAERKKKAAARKRKKTMAANKRKTSTKKKTATKQKDPKRVEAGKKAARTRKRNARKGKTMAKRTRKRKGKMTKAQRSAAAKKGWRKRRRNNPKLRYKKRKGRVVTKFRARKRPGMKKKHMHKVRRRLITPKKGKSYYKYVVTRNPGHALLNGLIDSGMSFGSLLAFRAAKTLVKPSTTYGYMDLLKQSAIPLLGFVGAAFGKSYVKKGARVFDNVQMGAGISLMETVLAGIIKITGKSATYSHLLPVSEYVPSFSEYVQQPYTPVPVGDYDVQPAVAEYIQDPGNEHITGQMGDFEVEEALADNEANDLQAGYSGGSLARTVFTV